MIPYMTRTEDVPPLYMLYAVVVHLDTLNASFSGHYVCYVRNLRGFWYRIDDTEVTKYLLVEAPPFCGSKKEQNRFHILLG